jgi:hypothetical protein
MMKQLLGSQLIRAICAADEQSLARLVRASLGDRRVALCFHRVAERRREGELFPNLTMPPAEIDRLICFLLEAVGRSDRWLTVSFDDGYLDSAEYILSRAPRFPEVEWLFFVCPEKTERQVGFRWDLAETRRRAEPGVDEDWIMFAPVDLSSENLRSELVRLAGEPGFRLADVELCRRIQRLPNGALGNHSNVHQRPALLALEQYRAEYEGSMRDFHRLFGPPAHFAFPFGTPEHDFFVEHVHAVRRLGPCVIWSTEPRPVHARERLQGAVLPRFAVDGRRTWDQTVAQISIRALRTRLWGHAGRYPTPAEDYARP